MGITRERLQHAVNSSDLGWSDQREKDVDVLTAMGITDSRGELMELGGELVILKTSTRSKSLMYVPGNDLYKATQLSAIEKLSSVTRHARTVRDVRQDQRLCLAGIALTEWIHDRCDYCHGSGRMKNDKGQIVAECQECGGTGNRTYADQERVDTLKAVLAEGEENRVKTLYFQGNETMARLLLATLGGKVARIDKLYFNSWRYALATMAETIVRAERVKCGAVADMLGR